MIRKHFSHLIAEIFNITSGYAENEVIGYDYRLNISDYGAQLLLSMQLQ